MGKNISSRENSTRTPTHQLTHHSNIDDVKAKTLGEHEVSAIV